MENVFLTTESGLTSTSANHLANLAKEMIRDLESKLCSINFVNENVEIINGNTSKILRLGLNTTNGICDDILFIAKAKSFCAWLREAIKAKEELLRKNQELSLSTYLEQLGIEYPECPDKPKMVLEEDVLKEWNVKERNRYLWLEAHAATFGKYIHSEGSISRAIDSYYIRLNNPTNIEGNGRDMIIYSYSPAIETEEIKKLLFELQTQHRDYEKQLNSLKFALKEEVNKRNLALTEEYKKSVEKYRDAVSKFSDELSVYKIKENERISALKIVIPDSFKDIFEHLNSL